VQEHPPLLQRLKEMRTQERKVKTLNRNDKF
jgi:hypothetical protein